MQRIEEEPVHLVFLCEMSNVNNDSNIFFNDTRYVYRACILFLETQFINYTKDE